MTNNHVAVEPINVDRLLAELHGLGVQAIVLRSQSEVEYLVAGASGDYANDSEVYWPIMAGPVFANADGMRADRGQFKVQYDEDDTGFGEDTMVPMPSGADEVVVARTIAALLQSRWGTAKTGPEGRYVKHLTPAGADCRWSRKVLVEWHVGVLDDRKVCPDGCLRDTPRGDIADDLDYDPTNEADTIPPIAATEQQIQEWAQKIAAAIREDMNDGVVPGNARTFEDLNDHVDANDYLEDAGVPYDITIEANNLTVTVQEAVEALLQQPDSVADYATRIANAIEEDINGGMVPADVRTFQDLHDHVDANEYVTQAGISHEQTLAPNDALYLAVIAEVDGRLARRADGQA